MKKIKSMNVVIFFLSMVMALALRPQAEIEKEPGIGENFTQFLLPDGRIDLKKAQQSGHQGSLNISNYDITLDPKTNEPLLRPTNSSTSRHPDDIYWTEGFSNLNGFESPGHPYAAIICNGDLIVAGEFSAVGGVDANNIATWNGSDWAPLDTGIGVPINSLGVYDNKLMVGTVSGLTSWDGSSWELIETGLNPNILAMTVFDNKLIAGGYFPLEGKDSTSKYIDVWIAAWDGISWGQLGSGIEGSRITSLEIYDNKLIAGGHFDSAGGVSASHIAAWDGSSWSSLGSGIVDIYNSADIYTLTVYDNRLIAGGHFDSAGGVATTNIAAWDGSSWSSLGWDYGGNVTELEVFNDQLIVSGSFSSEGYIKSWDGISWDSLGIGLGSHASDMIIYNNNLVVLNPNLAGGIIVDRLAKWDGTNWSPFVEGTNQPILSMTIYDGKLIAGGNFTYINGTRANKIASWDGLTWSPLGDGISGGWINALTVYNGELMVGGEFTEASGIPVNNIAVWNGTTWDSLGSGIEEGRVLTLETYNNNLYAGGQFLYAGGDTAHSIASWNGSVWSDLGNEYGDVNDLIIFNDQLIVGGIIGLDFGEGYFQVNIAAWDGTAWDTEEVADTDGWDPVSSLAVYNNQLIAGGTTSIVEWDIYFGWIYYWDGTSWMLIHEWPVSSWADVYSLFTYGNRLLVGGRFTEINGTAANNIAAWNGTSWSSLGSGVSNRGGPRCMVTYDNNLIAGGYFTEAGNKVSAYIAQWTKSFDYNCGDINSDDNINILDITFLINYLYKDGPVPDSEFSADVNYDGVVNILDVTYLIGYLYMGGPEPDCP